MAEENTIPIVDVDNPDYKDQIVDNPTAFLNGDKLPGAGTVDEASVKTIRLRQSRPNTEWIEYNGVTFRFMRVPPLFYNQVRAEMAKILNERKPQPQEYSKGGQKTKLDGKSHPAYLEALHIWETAWNSLDSELSNNVAALHGIEVLGGIPEKDEWLGPIKYRYKMLGIDLDKHIETHYGFENKDIYLTLLFHKEVVLADNEIVNIFRDFQQNVIDHEFKHVEALDVSAFFRPNKK